MTDVTVVSALLAGDGLDLPLEQRIASLRSLVKAGVPVVLYTEEALATTIESDLDADNVVFHRTGAEAIHSSFPLLTELEAAYASGQVSDDSGLRRYTVGLTKMGMLHDQSIWSPFSTSTLVWVDSDITNTLHPLYLSKDSFGALSRLLSRFLFLSVPEGEVKVSGRLFGGHTRSMSRTNALYYQIMEHCLRAGELVDEQAVFARMVQCSPAEFDLFELQGNGLPGHLFHQMRSGRVTVETTRYL